MPKWQGLLGENLAAQHYLKESGVDVDAFAQRFLDEWIKSEPHRDNLAYPAYDRTGVGAAVNGDTVYVAAAFRQRYGTEAAGRKQRQFGGDRISQRRRGPERRRRPAPAGAFAWRRGFETECSLGRANVKSAGFAVQFVCRRPHRSALRSGRIQKRPFDKPPVKAWANNLCMTERPHPSTVFRGIIVALHYILSPLPSIGARWGE